MTNEQNKRPNVAESVARSVKRIEERLNSAEVSVHGWLNQLESAFKNFTLDVMKRFIGVDEADEDEDDEDE